MGERSAIEWTDATWNPIRARNRATGKIGWHCEHESDGCRFRYAEGMNKRFGTGLPFKPGHRKDIDIFLDEKMLLAPLRWKHPRMVFVCSMTDLFAEFVPDEWIDRVFAVMVLCPQHTFQCLTKRATRMSAYCNAADISHRVYGISRSLVSMIKDRKVWPDALTWPLSNCWLGVSAERQQEYDERKAALRATPAAVHFFSFEPLLSQISADYLGEWAICGGESGPRARAMHPMWALSLRDQCAAAGVPFFFKQHGEWLPFDDAINIDGINVYSGATCGFGADDSHGNPQMLRVGKKAAGRLLDGVEHNAMPESP